LLLLLLLLIPWLLECCRGRCFPRPRRPRRRGVLLLRILVQAFVRVRARHRGRVTSVYAECACRVGESVAFGKWGRAASLPFCLVS
jgi:hypothetical protein